MFNIKTIGIIGQGFVGGAVREGMKHAFETIETYDKFKKESSTCSSLEELCSKSRFLFLCLPTPMRKDGSCDLSIVESTLEAISLMKEVDGAQSRCSVTIKSTIPPGTTKTLHEKYANKGMLAAVMFNPEFLTEANAVNDFKNQDRIVLGDPGTSRIFDLERVYTQAFPAVYTITVDSTTAEMVKYTANTFLATKVSFANEIFEICEKLGISYPDMIDVAKLDRRLGESHWLVPGPMKADDGSGRYLRGFAGSCFVKDINALICEAKKLGVTPKMLEAVWDKNLDVRPERDWEKLKGRAVSEE